VQDKQIITRVDELVAEEHQLRQKLAAGELSATEEHERLKKVEEELDQCWDLLRQRRAKQAAGLNADDAATRPVSEVESYVQ
jgi:predicted nuclease with TOPRIM domain